MSWLAYNIEPNVDYVYNVILNYYRGFREYGLDISRTTKGAHVEVI
jgi:hypothetical protein